MYNKIFIHFIEMNYIIIILGVVVIILLFYLYMYLTSTVNTLAASVSLNKNSAKFDAKKLKNPSSVHYAYGVWIFINTWTSGITPAPVVFSRADGSQLKLYFDSTKPTLYYSINATDGGKTQTITNNFPIQSWTQIIFSVDNNIVDIYMNGKLILSNVYQQGLSIPSSDATAFPVILGDAGTPFDANVASFQQWANQSVDPQTAWKSYMSGNGLANKLSSYNIQLQLLKDNVTQSTYSAF